MSSRYQFIIICATEERKQKMEEQFRMLLDDKEKEKETEKPICKYYLDASLIRNSADYLAGYNNEEHNLKNICCSRSHIRALKYASDSRDNYEFSIILEDDAAFYKEKFLESIEEILDNWHIYKIHKMISIGWIPCQNFNYSTFLALDDKYKTNPLKTIPGTKITQRYFVPGLQGYIVKNSTMKPFVDYLFQPTYIDFCNKMKSWDIFRIQQKQFGSSPIMDNNLLATDTFLHFLLNQATVFPPLLIEQDVPSLLGHQNKNLFWDVFFKGYESELEKYIHL